MAGSLIKVDEFTISSPVASVILGGGSSGSSGLNASIDSTYDVYVLRIDNVAPDTDVRYLQMRVTESGTPNTTANYDRAVKQLRTGGAFVNGSGTNGTFMYACAEFLGTGTQEVANGVFYIFNAPNASEYTFFTKETTFRDYNSGELKGDMGGMVFTSNSAVDGVQFFMSANNINSGSFVLYGLKK